MSQSNSFPPSPSKFSWTPLEPANFERISDGDNGGCRFAKDEKYLEAVLQGWKYDISKDDPTIVMSPYVYQDLESTPLYGYIVCSEMSTSTTDNRSKPAILLFHTAAGPHDVFLFSKAYLLVKELDCIVMICDVLSDSNGWAWGPDRTNYNNVRMQLAQNDHRLLSSRVQAAITAVLNINENDSSLNVDKNRLAMLGWCLGGQPILEVPRIEMPDCSIRAMVTYHGVFHRDTPLSTCNPDQKNITNPCKVLICNGNDDPFVSMTDIDSTKEFFENAGYTVEIAPMEGAKHGFTNPAQAFNDNESFDYNEVAATKSWERTIQLLKQSVV